MRRYLLSLAPGAAQDRSSAVLERLAARIGGWVPGQSALCGIVGLATFGALRLIGVAFAVPPTERSFTGTFTTDQALATAAARMLWRSHQRT